ncbi:cation:proton antiporter [Elongatibacter sediminis]|uniref:Sodium:proton antiporter n=1 Tax=Elongatibacter sediminis TaxID=3119006 RepID=A0AAW9R610_9GAMM
MEHGVDLALQISLVLALGAFCQWLAWRLRIAAILPLLLAGLLLGPALGVLNPDEFLGDLLFPVISLGVAIILFEGSLTLRISDIHSVTRIIRNLTSVGVLVTCGVMAAAAYYLAGLDLYLSLLFGALVSVTGPTVIMPMLRSIQPTARIANILRWEGILVDPIGAVLAVLVFELILSGQDAESLLEFGKVIMLGSVWGLAGGVVLGHLLKRHLFPDYLENYAALAWLLLVFTASNALGHESGLIAVTVMGIVLANTKDLDVEELLSFKEHLTIVLISMLFILLAARLNVEHLASVGVPALLILAVALFVARPLSVLVSSIGSSLKFREGLLLSWIAPRGIVAAAISSLFALRLEGKAENADLIVPLTFAVIIGTVLVQSLTAGWLARRLGLSSRGEQGVLITGANKVSLAIGEALHEAGIKVLVADTTREGLQQARMKGLETYYGSPLSEHADRYMDLTGYTELLALSRNTEANAMVCARLRHDFGHKHVFSIVPYAGEEDNLRKELAQGLRANLLFTRDATWKKLASLLGQGARIKATSLTEEFDYEAFNATQKAPSINLFGLNERGRLKVFSNFEELNPEPGWTVISLTTESPEEKALRQNGRDPEED